MLSVHQSRLPSEPFETIGTGFFWLYRSPAKQVCVAETAQPVCNSAVDVEFGPFAKLGFILY